MPILRIAGTDTTPEISFNALTGVLNLEGRSILHNPETFYKPLLNWFDRYLTDPRPTTTLNINLEYVSTSSTEFMFELLRRMKKLSEAGKTVSINWNYQEGDDDMKETGEEYADATGLTFAYVEQE